MTKEITRRELIEEIEKKLPPSLKEKYMGVIRGTKWKQLMLINELLNREIG